jgi:hypothetical protein
MRRLAALAAVLVLAGALAGEATAAIALVFGKLSARPGERMSAYQPGGLAWKPGERTGITVYLIPYALAPRFGPPLLRERPRRAWLLGELVGDSRGVGRVVFRVPRVPPGRYTTAVRCRPCGDTWFASRRPDLPPLPRPDRGILRVRR